jgi:hypothetical protein
MAVALISGCEQAPDLRVVQLHMEEMDDGWFGPLNQWGLYFGPTEEGGPIAFMHRGEGEFLLPTGDDEMIFLPILPSDGPTLFFGGEQPVMTLGGSPIALFLDEEDDWVWLGHATPEEKASLRAISVTGDLTPERMALLRDLATHNPTLDLTTEQEELIPDLLDLFDPQVAVVGESDMEAAETALLSQEARLKTLMVSGYNLHGLDFLTTLPNLETFFMTEWDPDEIGAIPGSLPAIQSIILSQPSISDLTALGPQPDLRELVLYDCDVDAESGVLDISSITRYPRLELLAFRDCDIGDLQPIGALPRLEWLGLTREFTQEELNQVVELTPHLTVLEFLGEEELTDLTPLTGMGSLKGLMVGSGAPVEPLLQMDQLTYLGLWPGDGPEESITLEDFELLQARLPETTVTVVAPFCLGSGLILLLVPLVGVFVILLGLWKGKRISPARHD